MDGHTGNLFVSVGQDAQLKLWKMADNDPLEQIQQPDDPCHSIPLNGVPHGVSHIVDSSDFVTCGEGISVWKAFR